MGKDSKGPGTHLSFSPPHDSKNGDNHVDGQRHVDGKADKSYGKENPGTQHISQSDGYGSRSADVPVRTSGSK
jgi:hypothetical protein